MIRAIFFDLDGTVVSGTTGTYSPAIWQAFDTLKKKGILLFAATGRSPYELKVTKMIDGLPFDGIISLNGQYCYTENETIHCQNFDKGDLERILQQLKKEPFPCMLIEKEDMYINFIDDRVLQVQECIHTPLPPVRDFSHVIQRDILMIMPYLSEEQTQRVLLPLLQNSSLTRWNDYCMDVVPNNCSKRTGIEKLMGRYQLCWDEIMAFGDGDNDYEMLQSSKYGIAMKNASKKLLEGDFYITDHVDEDGIVTALQHFKIL